MRWIPVALMLALPLAAQDEARTIPAGNILREWRFASTKLSGEQYRVIRDAADWKAFWKEHNDGAPPKVDWEREMAVAAVPRDSHEIAWVRTTRIATPGRSKLWVGLCPAPAKVGCHVAVMARSDLDLELWLKDPSLQAAAGQEADRGGFAVDAKLVRGAAAVWSRALPAMTEAEAKEVRAYVELLSSNDMGDREQGQRGLLRFGPRVRPAVAAAMGKGDAEMRARAQAVLDLTPTFDAKAAPVTREQAILLAREHVSKEHPTQFTNDPDMRWEDGGVRYTAGPHWRVHLRYL